ncbi:glucokinase [Methanomicrobium sp. W14]|uniref:ROK family protein n=1 Tax=Methanomicrobium sp. W14 TaxID=2817839 RepID=UPI001AE33B0B|nr:ROK family protein [Methanomicrobium sp. W14]MBP2132653.1 glucokinase [Methanomicrobium sp. W14]
MNGKKTTAIAVDIGATHIRAAYFKGGNFTKSVSFKTPQKGNSGDIISKMIIKEIHSVFSRDEIGSAEFVGVSSAGPLDVMKGKIVNSPNMAFPEIKIQEPLENDLLKDVYLVNDCRSGVLGEVITDPDLKDKTVVYITFSTGIGAGVYSEKRLLLGRNGNAGEIGHIFVDGKYLLPCRCGFSGHWEAYSSGTGIPGFFREFCMRRKEDSCAFGDLSAGEILENAKEEKGIFREFTEELGIINSRGIAAVIAAYSPEIIIIDGPVVRNNSHVILEGITKHTDRYLNFPVIRLSGLKGFAPLYGAIFYALLKRGEERK